MLFCFSVVFYFVLNIFNFNQMSLIAYAETVVDSVSTSTTTSQQQPNQIVSFLPFILVFVAMYFFMIRPQQKKYKQMQEMISKISIGDKVITTGGIVGTVAEINQDNLIILTSQSKIEVLKKYVSELLGKK
jgi:preprotein translocase subunit YajC